MTDAQMGMVVARLDRIDRRLDKMSDRMTKLDANAVTWKTLLAIVGTMAVVITSVVTVGNQLWGA